MATPATARQMYSGQARHYGLVRHRLSALLLEPSVMATQAAMNYTTGVFYMFGGMAAFLASVFPGWDADANLTGIRAIGGVALLSGLGLLFVARIFPVWMCHAMVVGGTILISIVILMSGSPVAAVAISFIYLYVFMDSVYFFGGRGLAAQWLLAAVCATLTLHHMQVRAFAIAIVLTINLGLSLVVAWLTRSSAYAERDQLTKLLNRRGLELRLESLLAQADSQKSSIAVLALDIDHFREINLQLGQHGGDQVLKELAHLWSEYLGPQVVLARFGADGFTAILQTESLTRAADLADELRAIAPVPTSAGVATWQVGDSASVLVGRAEVALYEAKEGGRGQTVVHGDPTRSTRELERAIDNGELVLEFQPVVSLADRSIVSFEALVRWNHPTKGKVPPSDFVPLAERTGAIHALGAWTLDTACSAIATAERQGRSIRVAVNASMPELRSPMYVDVVLGALAAHGLGSEHLTIEMTESIFDEGDPQVEETIKTLRANGVKVAIDDFGAGYSSLRWLDRFEVDILKVDRAFLEPLSGERQQTPVLTTIIGIGRQLGLTVIIEGVETELQAHAVAEMGAELAQGYLFAASKPLVDGRLPVTLPKQSV